MNRFKRCKCYALLICSISTVGCGHRPPFPPPLDPSVYADQVQSQLLNDTDLLSLDVAGVRIAKRGVYIDLVAQSKSVDERTMGKARTLGFLLSVNDEPGKFIEITDPRNRQVHLLPMRRPMRLFGGSYILYRDPPTYPLDDERLIQVCVFRTTRQLGSGTYHIRFTDAWESDTLIGGIGRPVSQQWRDRSVD